MANDGMVHREQTGALHMRDNATGAGLLYHEWRKMSSFATPTASIYVKK